MEGRGRGEEGDIGDMEGDEEEVPRSNTGETLPVYRSEYTHGNGRSVHSSRSPTRSISPIPPVPLIPSILMQPIHDAVGIWAEANRYLVSPDLERRLRSAGYLPNHDPERIGEDAWRERYSVSEFELDTLKELYSTRCVRCVLILSFFCRFSLPYI